MDSVGGVHEKTAEVITRHLRENASFDGAKISDL